MHYHMQNEQYRKVVEVCELYGDQEPSLWEQALAYFAHKEEDCKEYITAVLKHIETKSLMPPLLGERTGQEGRLPGPGREGGREGGQAGGRGLWACHWGSAGLAQWARGGELLHGWSWQ